MVGDHQPLLFEMLRSFSSLAKHLNLSAAVAELGSTRQTVRRHIDLLEEAKGVELFEVKNRQYRLTEAGQRSLHEADTLLARGRAWLSTEAGFEHGMLRIAKDDNEFRLYLQQQSLAKVWHSDGSFLRTCIQAWANSGGDIEHEAFLPIRPYAMIFRPFEAGWVCTEVGKLSSFATWYGWEWQSSSVGRTLGDLPGGPLIANLMAETFNEIRAHNGLRYDHVHTAVARKPDEPVEPLSYMRLLLGARYADGSFALVNFIKRTNSIEIEDMPEYYQTAMDPGMEMRVTL